MVLVSPQSQSFRKTLEMCKGVVFTVYFTYYHNSHSQVRIEQTFHTSVIISYYIIQLRERTSANQICIKMNWFIKDADDCIDFVARHMRSILHFIKKGESSVSRTMGVWLARGKMA